MRSIVIALLAFQLGHVSIPAPAAPAPVVVLPQPPVLVTAPSPLMTGTWEPCTCNNPCGDCGRDASRHFYFHPAR
jgi:hypothetical protein